MKMIWTAVYIIQSLIYQVLTSHLKKVNVDIPGQAKSKQSCMIDADILFADSIRYMQGTLHLDAKMIK